MGVLYFVDAVRHNRRHTDGPFVPFCRTLTIWCYQCDAALDPFKDEGTLLSPAAKVFLKTVARCLVTYTLNTICDRKERRKSKAIPLCMIPFFFPLFDLALLP